MKTHLPKRKNRMRVAWRMTGVSLLLFFLVGSYCANADNIPLETSNRFISAGSEAVAFQDARRGTVTDSNGQPLPGVSVLIKGTTIGTVTDADGNYSITVPDGSSVLTFSFIGFVSQ